MAYATGDDLNPPIRGHGYTAPIVARGLWIYRDSRKNGSGRTAHMTKGSSMSLIQIRKVREAS